MANAYTLAQALQLAGKDLTREGPDQGGQRKRRPAGAVPASCHTATPPTDHGGYSGVEMGQVRAGKIALFGGPLVTEPTASSPITPYTTAQPAPPASGVSVP